MASSIVTSSQNTATNTRQQFLIAQIHNPPCFYSLNLAQYINLLYHQKYNEVKQPHFKFSSIYKFTSRIWLQRWLNLVVNSMLLKI